MPTRQTSTARIAAPPTRRAHAHDRPAHRRSGRTSASTDGHSRAGYADATPFARGLIGAEPAGRAWWTDHAEPVRRPPRPAGAGRRRAAGAASSGRCSHGGADPAGEPLGRSGPASAGAEPPRAGPDQHVARRAGRTRRRPRATASGPSSRRPSTVRRWWALNAAAIGSSSGSAGRQLDPPDHRERQQGRAARADAGGDDSVDLVGVEHVQQRRRGDQRRRRPGRRRSSRVMSRCRVSTVTGARRPRLAARSARHAASRSGSRSYRTQCCGPGSVGPASGPSSRCRSRGRG